MALWGGVGCGGRDREAGGFLMSPPVCNLRAVSLIPLFYISSLALMSIVLSLFLFDPFLLLAHCPDLVFPKPPLSER